MKKLGIALILALLLTAVGVMGALAEEGTLDNGLSYSITDGKATITGCDSSVTEAVIPAEINGCPVTGIGYQAFYSCTSLTSITIPESVASIGEYAFYRCIGLTSVTIPEGVTSIGASAFSSCNRTKSVTIPASVTNIGDHAFYGCYNLNNLYIASIEAWLNISFGDSSSQPGNYANNWYVNGEPLTSLVIPYGVTGVGDYAFYGCTGLTGVTIPSSVVSIGSSAFSGCTGLQDLYIASIKSWLKISFGNYSSNPGYYAKNWYVNGEPLTSLVIPYGVTGVGDYAFYGCTGLTGVTIPNSVVSIGSSAFYGCTGLTDVSIPNSVTSIGTSAFSGCTGLTGVTVPNSVVSIGEYAFDDCTCLTSISIPDSVASIGNGAFNYCTKLNELYIASIEAWLNTSFGDQYSNPGYYAKNWYVNGEPLTNAVIPEGITGIGDYAFYRCTGLTGVTIPNSVTSIGKYAFYRCTGLTGVTVPNSVVSIGEYAFDGCTGLTSISIPESVTSIGDSAFWDCSKLKDLHIASIESWLMIPFGSHSSQPGHYAENWYVNETPLTSVVIPDGITSIGDYAFDGCTGLTSVTIPDSVISIGECAFRDCTSLISVSIPESVTSIGKYTFNNCSSLTNISIPESVTSIDNYAFSGCTSLTGVILPDVITNFGMCTFENCTSLTSVILQEGITNIGAYAFSGCTSLTDISIPESVTSIYSGAFSGCTSLTSVSIPDSVTSIYPEAFSGCTSLTGIFIPDSVIGIDYGAFSGCTSLTSVILPDGITSIGSVTFENCTSLTGVTIPDSVTSIGIGAFSGCTRLTGVILPDDITSIGSDAFKGCSSLTVVNLPYGVTSIGYRTFSGCTGLTSFSIPGSVTRIYDQAFYGCTGLTKLTIQMGAIGTIPRSAFSECWKIQRVVIYSDMIEFDSEVFPNRTRIYCYEGSEAASWAAQYGYPVTYLDDFDIDAIRTITLEPDFRIARGETRRISYTLFPDDERSEMVIFESSDPDVVDIVGTEWDGIFRAYKAGTATITATFGSAAASVQVTVYISPMDFELSADEMWIVEQTGGQLHTVSLSEGSEMTFTFSSDDPFIADIDSEGVITANSPGDVVITVIGHDGISKKEFTYTCLLHVCYPVTAIEMAPTAATVPPEATQQLTANVAMLNQRCVNQLVTWASSNEAVAAVDENGLVTALAPGVAVITAASANDISASCVIQVSDGADPTLILPADTLRIEESAFDGVAAVRVVVPEGCTDIGSRAFAGNPGLLFAELPASVDWIAEDAFDGSDGVTILCPANSPAAQWAQANGVPFVTN